MPRGGTSQGVAGSNFLQMHPNLAAQLPGQGGYQQEFDAYTITPQEQAMYQQKLF